MGTNIATLVWIEIFSLIALLLLMYMLTKSTKDFEDLLHDFEILESELESLRLENKVLRNRFEQEIR